MAYAKCQYCGKQLKNKTLAYKVTIGAKPKYYCNEKEYQIQLHDKEIKQKTYEVIYQLFGYKVTNSVLTKGINELIKTYSYDTIYHFLLDNCNKFDFWSYKSFQSEYSKIQYFIAIINNHIRDYREATKVVSDVVSPIEIYPSKYVHKKRKSLNDYREGDDC